MAPNMIPHQKSSENYSKVLITKLLNELGPLIPIVEQSNLRMANSLVHILESLKNLLKSSPNISFQEQIQTLKGLGKQSLDLKNQIAEKEHFLRQIMPVINAYGDSSHLHIMENTENHQIELCSSFPLPLFDFDQASFTPINNSLQSDTDNFSVSSSTKICMQPPPSPLQHKSIKKPKK